MTILPFENICQMEWQSLHKQTIPFTVALVLFCFLRSLIHLHLPSILELLKKTSPKLQIDFGIKYHDFSGIMDVRRVCGGRVAFSAG